LALTDNLISYYEMEDASGNATDSHGSNTLTDNNTVGSATGKISNGRDFERDNSEYLSLADNADFSFADEDFSIACWVKFETVTSFGGDSDQRTILTKGTDGTAVEYEMFLDDADNCVAFTCFNGAFFANGGKVTASTFGALSTGTWYHVVAWHDSVNNQLGISVNDTADTTAFSTGCYDGGGAFRVGGGYPYDVPTRFMDGVIDELGVWGRVLTSGERTSLYNSGSGLAYSSFGGGTGNRRRRFFMGVS
jgi:hypothetical protein